MYMTAVLMSVGSRVIKSRVIYRSWLLVHHHIVGGATTAAAWVGLGAYFGKPSMESILSCGVPRTLNTIWDTMSKLKIGRAATSQVPYALFHERGLGATYRRHKLE